MKVIDYLNNGGSLDELKGAPYYISVKKDWDYYILKYTQFESDFSNDIVKECRGLIITEVDGVWKCVCHAMNKFFNFGESEAADINWEQASVQEKVDGSLVKFWFDKGWYISTNGTIDAFKAPLANVKYENFGSLILAALRDVYGSEHEFFNDLDVCNTYMFELVSPYNKVVLDYPKTELYFLGARDMITDKEINPEQFTKLCQRFKVPKRYPLNDLSAVIDAAAVLGEDGEGFVVCDNLFNRIKVKSPIYVAKHYAMTGVITKEHLLDVILKGEVEEFTNYISLYNDDIATLTDHMEELYAMAYLMEVMVDNNHTLPRKEFAEYVHMAVRYKEFWDFCFKHYDGMSWVDYVKDWSAAKWLKLIEGVFGND